MLTIDIDTARRFILGKQGLWPGRRWRGLQGTEQAMRAMEYLQGVELQILHRTHGLFRPLKATPASPGPQALLAEDEATGRVDVDRQHDDLPERMTIAQVGARQRVRRIEQL